MKEKALNPRLNAIFGRFTEYCWAFLSEPQTQKESVKG